jgi:hypothetical protein
MTGTPRLPDWDRLDTALPDIAAPMRRYLLQLTAILRPGSVTNADQALRSLAAFLAEQAPDVGSSPTSAVTTSRTSAPG